MTSVSSKRMFDNALLMGQHIVGNKAKEPISKLVLQENKARQIFRKTNFCYHVRVRIRNLLCFLETPVMRFVQCNSPNLIYLITYKGCSLQYIGKTAQNLNRLLSPRSGFNQPSKYGFCRILSDN